MKLVKLEVLVKKTGKGAAKQLRRHWTYIITAILCELIYKKITALHTINKSVM